MPRSFLAYLQDIYDSINEVEEDLEGVNTLSEFQSQRKTQRSIERNLEIIGEAVKHLPTALTDKYPEIQWRNIAGLRDVLIHGYFHIESEILWDVCQNKLPELKRTVIDMLKNID